jgi:hypothetical protein
MRRPGGPLPPQLAQVSAVLRRFGQELKKYVEQKAGGVNLMNLSEIDISLMVYDRGTAETCPLLRVVGCAGKVSDSFWEFSLEVGDGNAGRAYKNRVVRCFDKSFSDPKRQTYVFIPKEPSHEFLSSFPLVNPDSPDLIFGIVNVGTFSPQQAILLRDLNNDVDIKWLLVKGHNEVLQELREIVKINQIANIIERGLEERGV